MHVLAEALVVALATGVVGSAISLAVMALNPEFSLADYTFWPQVFISYFLTGLMLHLIFETSGANKWYCQHGHACKK